MDKFNIGQIFEDDYPPEAAEWCNTRGDVHIEEIELKGETRRFQIVENPKPTPEEQEAEFNRQFFNTSLGYVRRNVTMKNGAIKDFLSDILPLLRVGVQILTYTKELEQNKVLVTAEFLEECSQQVLKDFYGE